jgi:ABC-type Co2+ transport system permease subunit
MYLSTGTGGVIGCIFAGVMTEYYHPKWCFFYYAFMGLFVSIFACRLTKESERDKVVNDAISENISTS